MLALDYSHTREGISSHLVALETPALLPCFEFCPPSLSLSLQPPLRMAPDIIPGASTVS